MKDRKFFNVQEIWKRSSLIKAITSTILYIVAILYIARLLMLIDAEDVIILNMFVILTVLFYILKGVATKTVYDNKLYLIALAYVNFYLQEKVILTLYSQLLKDKLLLLSLKEISTNSLSNSTFEIATLQVCNEYYLEYLNIMHLGTMLSTLNDEFLLKIGKIVDEAFLLAQLTHFSNYLTNIGVLENGTNNNELSSKDIAADASELEMYDYTELVK